jgi:hypothetical protein
VRTALRAALLVLALAAATLGVVLVKQVAGSTTEAMSAGEVVPVTGPVYGLESTIVLPRSEVDVRVGEPVASVPHSDLSGDHEDEREDDDGDHQPPPDLLAAPEGGRLVPVTWRVRAQGGFGAESDRAPTTLRLVAGDERVELWADTLTDVDDVGDSYTLRSAVVAVPGEPDLTDLAIEVDFDGLVQTLDVATGEIDAGVAQSLYDPRRFATGCDDVRDDCDFAAASPDQPLRPATFGLTATAVSLYPYDGELGWADEGTLWAATRVQVFGGVAFDAAGRRYSAPYDGQRTTAEIDGAEPVLNEIATGRQYGRIVFSVPEDASPAMLLLEQRATFYDSDRVMPVRAEIPLG